MNGSYDPNELTFVGWLRDLNVENNNSDKQSSPELLSKNSQISSNDVKSKNAVLMEKLSSIKLAVWSYDSRTKGLVVNDHVKLMFDVAQDSEFSLRTALKAIPVSHRGNIQRYLYKGVFSQGLDLEFPINTEHNNTKWLKLKGETCSDNGKSAQEFSGIIEDITHRKTKEIQKNEFINLLSHELRTPLSLIKIYVQTSLNLLAEKRQMETDFLQKADAQADIMTQMIEDFLGIDALESNQFKYRFGNFDLTQLIQSVIDELRLIHYDHHIVFRESHPILVKADRSKIGQVIINYVTNAVKYSPKNSQIAIGCRCTGAFAEVTVSDHGIGIPRHDQSKIFQQYYRINNDRGFGVKGFGLGLYFVAKVIHAHQGKVWLNSEPDKGSEFSFSLPLQPIKTAT